MLNRIFWTGAALGAAALVPAESGLAQCHDCTAQLSLARFHLDASTSLGDFVLFQGGWGVAGASNRCDIYDACADLWAWIEYGTCHMQGAATTCSGLALFGGGTTTGDSFGLVDVVTIYDSSKGDPTDPNAWSEGSHLSSRRRGLAATSIGKWSIFAGGIRGSVVTDASDEIDLYDCENDIWYNDVVHLSSPRYSLQAVTMGDYALFIGGWNTSGSLATVDWYDMSKGEPTDPNAWDSAELLSVPRYCHGLAAVGTKAIVAGGLLTNTGPACTDSVEIYDSSLGEPDDPAAWHAGPPLSVPRHSPSVTTVGCLVYFAGGIPTIVNGEPTSQVDVYDDCSGTWTTDQLCVARVSAGAGSACGKAVFAGGFSGIPQNPVALDAVDIFHDCDQPFMPCFTMKRLMLNKWFQAILARGTFDAGPDFDPVAEEITFEVTDVATGQIFTHHVPAGGMQLLGNPASEIYAYETPYGTLPDFRVHIDMKKCTFRLDRSKGESLMGVEGPDLLFRMITGGSGVGKELVTTTEPGQMWLVYLPGNVPSCCD